MPIARMKRVFRCRIDSEGSDSEDDEAVVRLEKEHEVTTTVTDITERIEYINGDVEEVTYTHFTAGPMNDIRGVEIHDGVRVYRRVTGLGDGPGGTYKEHEIVQRTPLATIKTFEEISQSKRELSVTVTKSSRKVLDELEAKDVPHIVSVDGDEVPSDA